METAYFPPTLLRLGLHHRTEDKARLATKHVSGGELDARADVWISRPGLEILVARCHCRVPTRKVSHDGILESEWVGTGDATLFAYISEAECLQARSIQICDVSRRVSRPT